MAPDSNMHYETLPFTMDEGIGSKARIGLVVLATDYTIEHEFRQIFNSTETGLFTARIQNETAITPQTLSDMEKRISSTVELILPGEKLDVVCYGCTSASMVMGDEKVFARIRECQPEALCTTPARACVEAFKAMNAKRIAVLTPYRNDVNMAVKDYLEKAGFEIPVFGSFHEEQDPAVARIDAKSISQGIRHLKSLADVDMIFVSCTNIRLMDQVSQIEKETGLPVTSSNHAMAWHASQLAGDTGPRAGFGKLFEKSIRK